MFSPSEKILLDANIWLYLFPPPGNPKRSIAAIYSTHFARMLGNGVQPVLDPLILSEYLNRYCRIEWESIYKTIHPKYKSFRNSSDFKSVGRSAASFARKISSLCARHSTSSDKLDIEKALSGFEIGESDFNDALIKEMRAKAIREFCKLPSASARARRVQTASGNCAGAAQRIPKKQFS
jgi:hypothetical protein